MDCCSDSQTRGGCAKVFTPQWHFIKERENIRCPRCEPLALRDSNSICAKAVKVHGSFYVAAFVTCPGDPSLLRSSQALRML
eukprot:689667-Amphidinium_carterae.8